jgi:Ca2+-transporting ATPase
MLSKTLVLTVWVVLCLQDSECMAGSASPLGLGLGKPALTSKLKLYGHQDVRAGAKATLHTSTRTPTQRISAPHVLSVELCLAKYGTSRTTGLSDAEAAARLATWGRNALLEKSAKSMFRLILEQFQDRLVQILLGVAVLSAVLAVLEQQGMGGMDMMPSVSWSLGAFVEPLVILSILVINAVVGAAQGRSAESSLAALKLLQPSTAHVLRGGQWRGEYPASEVVPGDVILLRVGDKVPADARLIELKTTTFSTDESSLTGEGLMVQKDIAVSTTDPAAIVSAKENMVFSGTVVCNGVAVAVVTGTGQGTEIGKINAGVLAAQDDAHGGPKKTPLAESLEVFGNQLTVMVACICLAVFAANMPRFGDSMFASKAEGAVHYAKIAVALGVAAIPEGLPAVVTLCLSLGTIRMAKRNVIVRKLASVETLGCASVICTDKTGTLTTNQMVVSSLVTLEGRGPTAGTGTGTEEGRIEIKERHVEGSSYAPVGAVEGLTKGCVGWSGCVGMRDLALSASLCNEASIELRNGSYARTGEPTEAALKVPRRRFPPKTLIYWPSSDPNFSHSRFS